MGSGSGKITLDTTNEMVLNTNVVKLVQELQTQIIINIQIF